MSITILTAEQKVIKDILSRPRMNENGTIPTFDRRVITEMLQFFDKVYKTEFKLVEVKDEYTMHVVTHDGRDWLVTRSTDFLVAPHVLCDGEVITTCENNWSPAITSVKWLLMLACVRPDE